MGQAATQLLTAARDGDIATVRKVLAEGRVDVNAADRENTTALYWASHNGHHDVVQTLLGADADVNKARSDNGWSPLMVASEKGHLKVVNMLIEAGANISQSNKDGLSPLMIASYNGHLDVVKALITAGANICQINKNNSTPLFMACQEGHNDVVQCLLGAGAGVNVNVARSIDNTTPLYVACDKGYHNIVQMLLEAGADVKIARSTDGWSALMVASYNKRPDILKTLIECGSNVSQANKDGKTAVDIAVERGHRGIVELLKTYQSKVITDMKQKIHDIQQQQNEIMEQKLSDVLQQKEQTEQQLCDIKQQKEQTEQQLCDIKQQKEQTEQQLCNIKQQKEQTEQQLHDTKQQAALELYGMKTQLEQQLNIIRQQKEQTVQQLRDMRQQKEQTEQQLRDIQKEKIEAELHDMKQHKGFYRQMSEPQLHSAENNLQNLSWHVARDEIRVIGEKPLGVGGWGEVKLAMFRGVKVAAKFIHDGLISSHNVQLFIREMNMAASIRHPNLLLFIGASLECKPVIISELMPANLRSTIGTLYQGHMISIGTDVACALNYLHLMKPDPIIHRDVSSANVLLEPIGSGNWRAKVSDFGSAHFVSKVATIGPGSPCYAAPEAGHPNLQSPKMDVYSYGILLLEMATGQFPDTGLKMVQLDTLQWQDMAAVVRKCISVNPTERPNMSDILLSLQKLNK